MLVAFTLLGYQRYHLSFTIMLVITFADQKLNIKLDMDKLDFDQFKSLNDLADVIIASK